jgi:hypothetical protein
LPDWTEQWSGGLNIGADVILTGDARVSRFMERFDPARVLREVEAKRSAFELHHPDSPDSPECVTCGPRWPCRTVEALATIYANHPGYREEWRP